MAVHSGAHGAIRAPPQSTCHSPFPSPLLSPSPYPMPRLALPTADTHTQTHTDTHTHRHTDTHRHTNTHRLPHHHSYHHTHTNNQVFTLPLYPTKPASSSMMCVFVFRRVCVPYSQHGVFGISFIALPASMRLSFPHSIYLYLSPVAHLSAVDWAFGTG